MSENLSHKERVLKAFAHEEGDRIPIFDQSIASDVASEILGREAFTGTVLLHYQEACAWMKGEQAHAEFEEHVYEDIIAVAKTLDFDLLRPPWRKTERPSLQVDEYTFLYGDPEGAHSICRFDPSSKAFGQVHAVGTRGMRPPDELEKAVEQTEQNASEYKIDNPWKHFGTMARMQKEYGEEYAVTGGTGISIPLDEEWLSACALRPDLVKRLLETQLQRSFVHLEAQAEMGLKIIWGGGDLADKNGPVYGPAVFREIFLPYLKRLTEKCMELDLYYLFRTDGNLWPVEHEFFVESGIHGYGEIDYEAGMHIPELKEKYGSRITFWGNVPTGTILVNGSPDEITEFTKKLIDKAAPQGGFILGSSNCIMPTTPAENVIALFETGRDYGIY